MASIRSGLIRFLIRRSNMWNKPLSEIRASMEKMKGQGMPEGMTFSKEIINGVPVEKMIPPGADEKKIILYFHGGGFCLGIYPANRDFVARIASESRIPIILPDFRLAPEHPYPAALEDAIAVFAGLLQGGYEGNEIKVMGDSSGCSLALSSLQVLKEGGVQMPSALAFITPVFDFTGQGESFTSRAGQDPFRLKDPLGIARMYFNAGDPSSPMISPLFGRLEGLPSMLIHAAEYDVFLSDAVRMAEKAGKAGVKVELRLWPQMWHIFHMQDRIVPESAAAIREICEFLKGEA